MSKGKGAPSDGTPGFKNPCLCTFLVHWVEKWEQNQSQVSAITGEILLSKVFNTVKCWYLRNSEVSVEGKGQQEDLLLHFTQVIKAN